MTDCDENILEKGPSGTIEYAIRKNGSRPAKDDLEKIEGKDYRKYSHLRQIMHQFVLVGFLPKCYMDGYSGSKIKKFKHGEAYPWRIPFFSIGTRHFLTHVFKKRGDKDIQKQIKKAEDIRDEHIKRMNRSEN